MGATINTGVDALVHLVETKQKITFKDAAKLLGVPLVTVEEWAHFLTEEGVVDVEYNMRNPVLMKVQLTTEQKNELKQTFNKETTLFHRRLEALSSYFEELDQKVSRVSKVVGDLDTHLEQELGDIKEELKTLDHLEKHKVNIHEELLDTKKRVAAKLKDIDKHLADERVRYKHFEQEEKVALTQEQKLFDQANAYLDKVRKDEKELEQKLKEVKTFAADIEKSIARYSKGIDDGEKRIKTVKTKHDSLVKDLEDEYKLINSLLQKNEQAEREFKQKVDQTLQSIKKHEGLLDKKAQDVKHLPSSIQDLIHNKEEIHQVISSIKHDQTDIEHDIVQLQEKSKLLEYKIGSSDYEQNLRDLHKKLDDLSARRKGFEDKLKHLVGLLHLK